MKKYKVNTEIRSFSNRIPSKAQKQLLTVGINKNTYPETGKNYFDTLRLIVSLGFSEGFTCNCLDLNMLNQQSTLDAFHVGGVAIQILLTVGGLLGDLIFGGEPLKLVMTLILFENITTGMEIENPLKYLMDSQSIETKQSQLSLIQLKKSWEMQVKG